MPMLIYFDFSAVRGVYIAYSIVAWCYFGVSFSGYHSFGSAVKDNVLASIPGPKWMIAMADFFVFIHVIGSTPLGSSCPVCYRRMRTTARLNAVRLPATVLGGPVCCFCLLVQSAAATSNGSASEDSHLLLHSSLAAATCIFMIWLTWLPCMLQVIRCTPCQVGCPPMKALPMQLQNEGFVLILCLRCMALPLAGALL